MLALSMLAKNMIWLSSTSLGLWINVSTLADIHSCHTSYERALQVDYWPSFKGSPWADLWPGHKGTRAGPSLRRVEYGGYSITGNTQSLHLCIGSSNLPTSIGSMPTAKIDRVLAPGPGAPSARFSARFKRCRGVAKGASYIKGFLVFLFISLFDRLYNSIQNKDRLCLEVLKVALYILYDKPVKK